MSLESSLEKIRSFVLDRYKNNLASILVFGSANTEHFVEGRSDIDTFILLKRKGRLNFEGEIIFLLKALKSEHFATQYFNTLKEIKRYIYERGSFSTYITIVAKDGSRIIYSTPEFERMKKWLIKNPLPKEIIKKQVSKKDRFELDGYLKKRIGYEFAKGLMAHFRRKLQIMNYFATGNFIFDYEICLKNSNLPAEEKGKLKKLYELYKQRKALPDNEIKSYKNLALTYTDKICKTNAERS